MEDAAFLKQSAKNIYKIRNDLNDTIQAWDTPHHESQASPKVSCPSSPQAAAEDIENASTTVKGWKSRVALKPFPFN